MLILSRRIGESVVIGHDIKVTICDVSWKWVNIGIKAPLVVPVHREEVYERILREEAARARGLLK